MYAKKINSSFVNKKQKLTSLLVSCKTKWSAKKERNGLPVHKKNRYPYMQTRVYASEYSLGILEHEWPDLSSIGLPSFESIWMRQQLSPTNK